MKKVLAATTATALTLALVGGAAFADVTISGDAKFGVKYNSAPTDENGSPVKSKLMFTREIGVDFIGSGTTDGGLSFGGKVGFDTIDGVDTGTVFVSGAFGTVTYGHDDAADALAGGIADVGLNGLGVDDVVEDIRGTTANQARYDLSVGNFALAISAGRREPRPATAGMLVPRTYGQLEVKKNSYAIGASFSASGVTLGLGHDSKKTTSVGIGYSSGQFSANAFQAKRTQPYFNYGNGWQPGGAGGNEDDITLYAGYSGRGFDLSYTMGASTLTMVYAKTEVDNIQPNFFLSRIYFTSATFRGKGIGFSHDLGGGASLVAGFAKVSKKTVKDLTWVEIGQAPSAARREDLMPFTAERNVANVGLSFSF